NNSQVISYRDIAMHASGYVFLPDPVTTSGNASLNDAGGYESIINGQRKSVTLLGLDSSGRLTGQYANTGPSSSHFVRAQSASGNFLYSHVYNYATLGTSDNPEYHLLEVMAYYHIDSIERYIQSLGFNNIQNRMTSADVAAFS